MLPHPNPRRRAIDPWRRTQGAESRSQGGKRRISDVVDERAGLILFREGNGTNYLVFFLKKNVRSPPGVERESIRLPIVRVGCRLFMLTIGEGRIGACCVRFLFCLRYGCAVFVQSIHFVPRCVLLDLSLFPLSRQQRFKMPAVRLGCKLCMMKFVRTEYVIAFVISFFVACAVFQCGICTAFHCASCFMCWSIYFVPFHLVLRVSLVYSSVVREGESFRSLLRGDCLILGGLCFRCSAS